MIDFHEPEDYNRTVFTLVEGKVVGYSLKDLCLHYAETTTSPEGVSTTFHTRGNELWTWGAAGNNPSLFIAFDSEDEAEHALLLSFRFDLQNGVDNPVLYDTWEEARQALDELIGVDDE